jgi:16S rRNA (uracil1498-N3)-methyltransferase
MKTTNRLYVPDPLRPGAELALNADRGRYVSRVLRLRAGDGLVLFDGSGGEYPATVSEVGRKRVTVSVGERREQNVESPLGLHLIQGVARGDRMDMVVQKATELGVRRITPVSTEFSVVRLDTGQAEKRRQHWTKIAQSACEQCGRNVVPEIDAPQPLAGVLRAASSTSARIVLRPGAAKAVASLNDPGGRVELLIGPEGGLSGAEYDEAEAAGFVPCSLGPRTLRTETAAIAALAVLQARWGDQNQNRVAGCR